MRWQRLLLLYALVCFPTRLLATEAFRFRFADLETIIRQHRVTSIDALLPLLPTAYTKHYTLLYRSQSAQANNVFPQQPRVVIYGPDASFIMAFTKNPKTAPVVDTEDSLETIEFQPETNRFLFRKLSFSNGQDPLALPPEINPASCLGCHGQDPRPNWNAYNTWPGVFGSVARRSCSTMQKDTPELRDYLAFMRNSRQSGRYRFLPPEVAGQECPYRTDGEYTFRNGASEDPNADFTNRVIVLNMRRLKRIIQSSPEYPKFQYAWAALGRNDCVGHFDYQLWEKDFFPADYAPQHQQLSYQETLEEVIAQSKKDFSAQLAEFKIANRGSASMIDRTPINFLDPADPFSQDQHRQQVTAIKVLADRMGMSMRRWSTNFNNGLYQFITPQGDVSYHLFQLWTKAEETHGDLSCRELAQKSMEALNADAPAPSGPAHQVRH